jgi:hypothetical protein
MGVQPDLASRVAKLLRLACCPTAPDGERLAAVTRLSAIAAAHDIDWDSTLNGHASPSGNSAAAGADAERLNEILEAALKSAKAGQLTTWETDFIQNVADRFHRYGKRIYVSPKQWAVLDRLEAKLRMQGW